MRWESLRRTFAVHEWVEVVFLIAFEAMIHLRGFIEGAFSEASKFASPLSSNIIMTPTPYIPYGLVARWSHELIANRIE